MSGDDDKSLGSGDSYVYAFACTMSGDDWKSGVFTAAFVYFEGTAGVKCVSDERSRLVSRSNYYF